MGGGGSFSAGGPGKGKKHSVMHFLWSMTELSFHFIS